MMVYNCCIGICYCLNNCLYKVCCFNFFKYNDMMILVFKLLCNFNVLVCMCGVMEKCIYCIQCINYVWIEVKKEDWWICDGEICMVCEEVCFVDCVVFGDFNDFNLWVFQWCVYDMNYEFFYEFNVVFCIIYLVKIMNLNFVFVGEVEQDYGVY